MQKKFNDIPKEITDTCIAEVITRIEEIQSDSVGVIAAQDVIDIVVQHVGSEIYNTALRDAKRVVADKLTDVEFELDELTQS